MGKADAADLDAVAQAAALGLLRIPVARSVPLGEAITAITELELNHPPTSGKLVVTTGRTSCH
jgi:hypothetical protein